MERAQRPASWRLNKVIMSVFPLSTQSFGEFTVFNRVVSTFLNAEAQRMKSCYKTRGHRGGKANSLHLCASAFIFRIQVSEVLICYAVGI